MVEQRIGLEGEWGGRREEWGGRRTAEYYKICAKSIYKLITARTTTTKAIERKNAHQQQKGKSAAAVLIKSPALGFGISVNVSEQAVVIITTTPSNYVGSLISQ